MSLYFENLFRQLSNFCNLKHLWLAWKCVFIGIVYYQKNLFTALVCHSNSKTNSVNESTFLPVYLLEKKKLGPFSLLAVCLDQLTSCSRCWEVCSECMGQKILQSQRISKKYLFGGIIGLGNSLNLHNVFTGSNFCVFKLVFTTLTVFWWDVISDPPASCFFLSALCNVFLPSAFANFSQFLIGRTPYRCFFWLVSNLKHTAFFSELVSPTASYDTMQMAFLPLSDSLHVRVWCETSNLSNLNNQFSNRLGFLCILWPQRWRCFHQNHKSGKIRAFRLVVRLSEEEHALQRKLFYLLDQLSTFYHSACRGNPNTGNFAYTSTAFQINNQFCVYAVQPEGTSNFQFVPHATTAGDNANAVHTSGIDNNACNNMSSASNSAGISGPLHPLP